MLTIQGKVVSKTIREIKYVDRHTGEHKSFNQVRVSLVNGGDPRRVCMSEDQASNIVIDEEVRLPVYVKTYRAGDSARYDLHYDEQS